MGRLHLPDPPRDEDLQHDHGDALSFTPASDDPDPEWASEAELSEAIEANWPKVKPTWAACSREMTGDA